MNNKNNANSLTTGLAVGVALGAAAVALSDEKNQKKVKNAINSAKKWAKQKSDDLKLSSNDLFDKTEEAVEDIKEKVN